MAHGQRSTIRLPKVPSLNPASSLTNLCKILLHACCSVTVRFQNKKREKLLEPGIDRKKKSSLIPTLRSKTLLISSSHKQCTAAPESWFDNTEGKEADSHNNSSETLSSGLCASVHVKQICNKLQLRLQSHQRS